MNFNLGIGKMKNWVEKRDERMNLEIVLILTSVVIPPTKIRFGTVVPNLGALVIMVPGEQDGDKSPTKLLPLLETWYCSLHVLYVMFVPGHDSDVFNGNVDVYLFMLIMTISGDVC